MVVNIVNQGHSFDLVESYGCVPEYYRSWLYIVFTRLPPVLVSLTALVYAGKRSFPCLAPPLCCLRI